ncbi:MAG: hypothetical protein V3U78_05415 [Thiotrichaceae bacterium]
MTTLQKLMRKIRWYVSNNLTFHFRIAWLDENFNEIAPKRVLYHFIDGPDDAMHVVLDGGIEVRVEDFDDFIFESEVI